MGRRQQPVPLLADPRGGGARSVRRLPPGDRGEARRMGRGSAGQPGLRVRLPVTATRREDPLRPAARQPVELLRDVRRPAPPIPPLRSGQGESGHQAPAVDAAPAPAPADAPLGPPDDGSSRCPPPVRLGAAGLGVYAAGMVATAFVGRATQLPLASGSGSRSRSSRCTTRGASACCTGSSTGSAHGLRVTRTGTGSSSSTTNPWEVS